MYKKLLRNITTYIKKNKKTSIIFFLISLFIIYLMTYLSPKISISSQIKNVTDKDYNMFVQYDNDVPQENKTRDNCRFLTLYLKVKNPLLLICNVKVDKPSLEDYLYQAQLQDNPLSNIKFLGQYYSGGNNEFSEGIDIYMDNMTDEKLKDFYKDYKIEVTWINILSGKKKAIFYLQDYIK